MNLVYATVSLVKYAAIEQTSKSEQLSSSSRTQTCLPIYILIEQSYDIIWKDGLAIECASFLQPLDEVAARLPLLAVLLVRQECSAWLDFWAVVVVVDNGTACVLFCKNCVVPCRFLLSDVVMYKMNADPRRPDKVQRYVPKTSSGSGQEDLTPDYMNILGM
ncbi:unnamed protein product [Callosobruchus maculatus]|uniref:Uncharacterized protein n=1 Tax=Callosobruchus maculatus TaxID=64391 RepID=A0A653D873_CALMS|nr:unnamed protein product [Callosobruchus maculatus]